MSQAESFDPYRDWLGIQPHERPVDHYCLLGLARFEADGARIASAADERMALVRSFQVGPRRLHTQKLLNELSSARLCLLSAPAKSAYDATLRGTALPIPAGFQPVLGISSPIDAPPIEPPPAPAPRVMLADETEPLDPASIAPPVAWWRPLVSMLAMALLVLAAAVAWGIIEASREPSEIPAVVVIPPPLPEAIEPEPPPEPEVIVQLQEGSGEVNLSPATAVLRGGVERRTVGIQESLGGFTTPEAAAQWQFRLVLPGFFQLELEYATAAETTAAALRAEIDGESKVCELRPTDGLDQFRTDTFTIAIPKSGQHTLVLRPSGAVAGDGLILKSVRLVPIGGAELK